MARVQLSGSTLIVLGGDGDDLIDLSGITNPKSLMKSKVDRERHDHPWLQTGAPESRVVPAMTPSRPALATTSFRKGGSDVINSGAGNDWCSEMGPDLR
jgi:hypothetical protein